MKLVTVGLFALGLVAAGSAAVLVASMQGGTEMQTVAPRETTIVVATRDLPAMAAVDQEALVTRTLEVGLAPAGSFTDPVQLIGKVLTAPVKSGQALTADDFANDGSALRLASALPPGHRMVSISLNDSLSDESLLYPGCMVDVLATMRITSASSGAQRPVTVTLLQGVTVMAVGNRSVVSGVETKEPAERDRGAGRPSVALLVDTHQAELLKLAMEEGSVSLVMRNPNDQGHTLADGADLGALTPARFQEIERQPEPVIIYEPAPVAANVELPVALPAPPPLPPPPRTWQTVVLRGAERENRTFDLPPASHP